MSSFNEFNPDILSPSIKVNDYHEACLKYKSNVCIFNNTTICQGSKEVNYLFDSIDNKTNIVGFHRNTVSNNKINKLGDGVFNIQVNGKNIESVSLITLIQGKLIKKFPFEKKNKSKWILKYFTERNPLLTASIPFVEYFIQIKFTDNQINNLIISSDHYILPPSKRNYFFSNNITTKNLDLTLKYTGGYFIL